MLYRSPLERLADTRAPAMREALGRAIRFAPSPDPILLLGERGTGKSTLARWIHNISGRPKFHAYSLGPANDDLYRNELFGHSKEAFTGATTDRPGLVEQSAGGTLFVDEFGLASPKIQEGLLAVFDPDGIRRVGLDKVRPVTARLIAATNADLELMAQEGHFREDLLDRMGFFEIVMPPLRDRREDLPGLLEFALGAVTMTLELRTLLIEAPWQGNIRELEKVARYLVTVVGPEGRAGVADLPPRFLRSLGLGPAPLEGPDRFRAALAQANGNRSEAARLLGVDRRTLQRYLARQRQQAGVSPVSVRYRDG